MKTLLIDTSGSLLQLELVSEDNHYSVGSAGKYDKLMISKIDELVKKSGVKLANLDCLAYVKGPGSFVGTRVGLSTAKAIGFANPAIKLVAMSSLQVLAKMVLAKNCTGTSVNNSEVIVGIDARNDEVYFAKYHLVKGLFELVGMENEALLSYNDFAQMVLGSTQFSCGLLVDQTQEAKLVSAGLDLSKVEIVRSLNLSCAFSLAMAMYQSGDFTHYDDVDANYVRDNVAAPKKQLS